MITFRQVVLCHFVVDDILSLGSQGVVALGHDRRTGAQVAIKQLLAVQGAPEYDVELARFLRAGSLHFNRGSIVDPIDAGEQDGDYFIVMPFIEGETLAQLLAARGRLAVDESVWLTLQIADGLQGCHEQKVVHRDVKTLNIIVRPDGTACLCDLGICRHTSEKTITGAKDTLGTPAYMSPEQTVDARAVDYRSDLYSLGAVFYEMLTGLPSAKGDTPEETMRCVREEIPPRPKQLDPSIPVHVDGACMQLLAKKPDDRFQSARDLIQALQAGNLPAAGKFCCSCGAPVDEQAAFCSTCGAPQGVTQQDVRCFACGASVGEAPVCPGCGRGFSHSDHRLIFTAGTLAGQAFRVPEATFLTGRDQLSARDFQISRRHLWVTCLDGKVKVQDAGSVNKTYVGGRLTDRPTQLSPAQELYLAGNIATYTHQ